MNIAIWGRNGCGKTTIAAELASLLAEQYVTSIICCDTSFSSIQHILDVEISTQKSLRAAIKDKSDPAKRFVEASHNLFVLAVSEQDDCLKIDDLTEDEVIRLYDNIDGKFHFQIMDCTQDFHNPLTFLAMRRADIIIEVIRATLSDYMFRVAYENFLKEFGFIEKVISVINQDRNIVSIPEMEKNLGIKVRCIFPYTDTIILNESNGKILKNAVNRRDIEYLKECKKLVNIIKGDNLNEI